MLEVCLATCSHLISVSRPAISGARPHWRPRGLPSGHDQHNDQRLIELLAVSHSMSSTGGLSRRLSRSSASKSSTKNSAGARHNTPPPTALTPENLEAQFEPCAATASFLLYAQQRTILVLHQDTLAIERRFSGHAEVVSWISVDNASERGSGRLAVSSDAGKTTIVWDILTGGEVARFSSYEHMLVANFMRNGNIAFGMAYAGIAFAR